MENEIVNQVVQEQTLLQNMALFMDEGGIFMWIILLIWTIGIGISVERLRALWVYDIDGDNLMERVKKHVLLNEVKQAIVLCSNSKALLAQVLKNGLKRANQSKEQIEDATHATILEVMPQVEKRVPHLALIANISTLMGLLGTIYGLIQSFSAVATADPASKAKLLALGISKAMNTTAMGLLSAISIMVIHSLLTSKSDKILGEIEEFSVKLVDILGTQKCRAKVGKDNE
ncbi:MAG: MotA/TolQ/ExbB proton channel family protein [Bdellovibrionales bacterium]|jgi:biopolymer transport protein ExbB|nr:MotA/TolQ/ExbB proton channel family protein [Bdellovibrionales bacterium]MBT3525386.1 MotA/TolQ/ExbB proton channel family protein [Bdellovibrionales bacterium]MBT7670125.1 MotA/TolQ/ExbB proton channel family protein [Bdellovibrionales bacterium]MBT7765996.1 MotA/TolQ/ExbB proton channel family protein [Bdellovibrionales bacterium]